MVIDRLSDSGTYDLLSPGIARGLGFLRRTDFSTIKPGRYEIDGTSIYAIVQDYVTKPKEEGRWEAHRKYIDLQYVAAGEERIGYADINRLTPGAYDESKDFLPLSGDGDYVTLTTGMFMLLYPHDGHMPGIQTMARCTVRKGVVKIAVG